MNPSTLKAQAPDLYRVKFATTHGDFVVEVHRAWAPLGADRFYNLVVNNFFDDAAFFRYVPGFHRAVRPSGQSRHRQSLAERQH